MIRKIMSKSLTPYCFILVALILSLSTIFSGITSDDFFHYTLFNGSTSLSKIDFKQVSGDETVVSSSLEMFSFFDRETGNISPMREFGSFPWWGDDELQISFWRPITAATHWLDYKLWPKNFAIMHLHNILWFVLALLSVLMFYKRFLSSTSVVAVAILMYALDFSIYESLVWLACRNVLLAIVFGMSSILMFEKWRNGNGNKYLIVTLILFLMSLLSAEAGIGTFAYFIAYLLVMDTKCIKSRILAILPIIALIVVWRLVYQGLGYGAIDTGLYVDPGRNPLDFLSAICLRAPVLLLNQITVFDYGYSGFANSAKIIYAAVGVFVLSLMGYILWPIIRRNKVAQFFLIGMILASIPVTSISFISGRLLSFVSIGAMGFIAIVIGECFALRPVVISAAGKKVKVFAVVMIILNVFISFIALSLHGAMILGGNFSNKEISKSLITIDDLHGKNIYYINSPHAFKFLYEPFILATEKNFLPNHLRILMPAYSSAKITRQDINSLIVDIKEGMKIYPSSKFDPDKQPIFNGLLHSSKVRDAIFRTDKSILKAGYSVNFDDLEVIIMEVNQSNEPIKIKYTFQNIEKSENKWLLWDQKNRRYRKFNMPEVGEFKEIPGMIGDIQENS